jgi:hypothetical protein
VDARLDAPVRLSFAFSCGCIQGKSEPVPAVDANSLPGEVVACPRHQEYAVVTRVSVYLADTSAAALERLLRGGGVEDSTAAQVAAEQASNQGG